MLTALRVACGLTGRWTGYPGQGSTCSPEFMAFLEQQQCIAAAGPTGYCTWMADNGYEPVAGDEGGIFPAGSFRGTRAEGPRGGPRGGGAGVRGFCSFSGDTKVLMADGTSRPISKVMAGDHVLATNPETGETAPEKVTQVWVHADTLVHLRVAGGTVTTTEDHLFWNESDRRWEQARDLANDRLLTATGVDARAEALVWRTAHEETAYNLTVAAIHTYYVLAGPTPVLVHNGCTNMAELPQSALRNLTNDSNYAYQRLNLNHGVTRDEFRIQIHEIKRMEGLPADFDVLFGPTGDVWNPVSGELIGHITHGR